MGVEPDDLCDDPEYRARVQYSPDTEKNCTLVLSEVKASDALVYYVRIATDKSAEKWLSSGVELRVTGTDHYIIKVCFYHTL